MLILRSEKSGFHSTQNDHDSIDTQKCWFCLFDITHGGHSVRVIAVASKLKGVVFAGKAHGFDLRGSDHDSIEIQKCWFCLKLLAFTHGGKITVASKLQHLRFAR